MAAKVTKIRSKARGSGSNPRYDLQFLVVLMESDPLVWRRIRVPDDYSFWDLHVAIQDAMGWTDSHLHVFQLVDPTDGGIRLIGIPDDEFPDERPCEAGWEVAIGRHFDWDSLRRSPATTYVYDFGDDWRHSIVFERIVPAATTRRPRCIAGERACPPEDCGGIPGFDALREVLSDPAHPERAEVESWLEGRSDFGAFDPEAVRFDDPKKRWRRAFGR